MALASSETSRPTNSVEASLAAAIVGENFGSGCEEVAERLLERGRQTLVEIVGAVSLSHSEVSDALFILIHHNCCTFFEERPTEEARAVVLYEASVSGILMRMRFPKLIARGRELFGADGEVLIEQLLANGRLPLEDLLKRSLSALEDAGEDRRVALERTFLLLLSSRLVMRVSPKADAVVLIDQLASQTKLVFAGPKKTHAEAQAEATARVAQASRAYYSCFVPPAGLTAVNEGETDITTKKGKRKKAESASKGRKRRAANTRSPVPVEGASSEMTADDNCLWRTNYAEFTRLFRHEACVELVKARINEDAAAIVEILLNRVQPFKPESSVFTIDGLARFVRDGGREDALTKLNRDTLKGYVESLKCDSSSAVLQLEDERYSMNLLGLTEMIHQNALSIIVEDRYGKESRRIFRLLLLKKSLEQKEIAELAMVPIKEARQTLYRMLADGFVQLLEVAKTPDRAPARTVYLWAVNLEECYRLVVENILLAMRNIKLRLVHHLDLHKALMDKARQEVALSQSEVAQFRRLQVIADRLETGLVKLDESLLLFREF